MSRYASLFSEAAESDTEPTKPLSTKPAVYHLLFVDDEPNVLNALRRVFHRENDVV